LNAKNEERSQWKRWEGPEELRKKPRELRVTRTGRRKGQDKETASPPLMSDSVSPGNGNRTPSIAGRLLQLIVTFADKLDPTLDFFAGTAAGVSGLIVGFPFDTGEGGTAPSCFKFFSLFSQTLARHHHHMLSNRK